MQKAGEAAVRADAEAGGSRVEGEEQELGDTPAHFVS